jgi:branched-chain amino acid transport system substrate-binding protein
VAGRDTRGTSGLGLARARASGRLTTAATLAALLCSAGCLDEPEADSDPNAVPLALLLSYTGSAAANSINSERAVRLAVERINGAGGLGGRPLRLVVRDIQSDGQRTERLFSELVSAGSAAFIGLDSPNVVTQFVQSHRQTTFFLPGVAITARDTFYGADQWFTFAPHTWTLACAFRRRLADDGVKSPLILHSPDAFHSELAFALGRTLGAPDRSVTIPSRAGLTAAEIESVLRRDADALLLMAFPESAAPVITDLSFRTKAGARWYLSPTLDTPRFFEVVPSDALMGARLATPGRMTGGPAFEDAFRQRWHDEPLHEAYGFYDAAALAALALQAALTQPGPPPTVNTLGQFVRPVAGPPGTPVAWNELERGLALIRAGQDVDYQGVSGQLDYDERGNPDTALVQWWRLDQQGRVNEGPPLVTAGDWGSCPGP